MIRKYSNDTPRGKAVTCSMMSAVRALTPRAANASPAAVGDDVVSLTMLSLSSRALLD